MPCFFRRLTEVFVLEAAISAAISFLFASELVLSTEKTNFIALLFGWLVYISVSVYMLRWL